MHPLARARQLLEIRKDQMVTATFDPKGPGVARIFLIPPKPGFRSRDSLLLINQWTVTISPSWARLLRIFIEKLNARATPGREIEADALVAITLETSERMAEFYPNIPRSTFENDLAELISIILKIAHGQDVLPDVFQGTTLAEYSQYLQAPLRMDLMVSPMRINGRWACPLNCGACYAANQPLMEVEPMDYSYWIQAIRKLGRIGVPELTFTGGEPLANKRIVALVEFAQQHLTRLNTSAVLLTAEVAAALYEANLDAMQITLYSHLTGVHDELVGQTHAWQRTVAGIRHAVGAGLLTSVNTPLLRTNSDYATTLRFIKALGVRYATCSGLIPTGGALRQLATGAALPQSVLYETLARAMEVAAELEMELSFTSPGALTDEQLRKLGLQVPACGACLENMAVTPGGQVVACQSALQKEDALGHIIFDDWHRIWTSRKCREMRKKSAGKNFCPLALRSGGDQ